MGDLNNTGRTKSSFRSYSFLIEKIHDTRGDEEVERGCEARGWGFAGGRGTGKLQRKLVFSLSTERLLDMALDDWMKLWGHPLTPSSVFDQHLIG